MCKSLLAISAFLSFTVLANTPKREDILSIQRDVAQMQDEIRQMEVRQYKKLAELDSLLKQAIDQQNKIVSTVATMERGINDRLAQQQSTMVQPVATLGTKLDAVAEENQLTRENVADLAMRLAALDNKLADISSAVRTLNTMQTTPPSGSVPGIGAENRPADVSAESLYQNAFRDYSSGKDELAMSEFIDFLKYFPMAENAPSAQYYIGQIYDRARQYDDSALAFAAVLERYPENPKTSDALYWKGIELMNAKRYAEAVTGFKEFLARYPDHRKAADARNHVRNLGQVSIPAARQAGRP